MLNQHVLFVCMGNICRSPTAEAVFRAAVERAGLAQAIVIDSAGTHDYHVGAAPDHRTQAAARARGYDLSGLRARLVSADDFARFQWIIAMDEGNLAILERMRPPDYGGHLGLMLDDSDGSLPRPVPDPYYGGARDFVRVVDLVEATTPRLLERVRAAL